MIIKWKVKKLVIIAEKIEAKDKAYKILNQKNEINKLHDL